MTRRYTGAEARELAERATMRPGQWGAVGNETLCFLYDGKGAVIASIEGHSKLATGTLLAAAPDLAESLAEAEAERDALQARISRYLTALDAHKPVEASLREAHERMQNAWDYEAPTTVIHACQHTLQDVSAKHGPLADEAAAALAALREAST